MTRPRRSHRPTARTPGCGSVGFTLVEMLVVIAVIGVLVMLLLPAIQAAREAARRFSCAHKLSQLMIAVHNYESAYDVYPPGTLANHHSWIAQLLPCFEQENVAALIDFRVGPYHRKNAEARAQYVENLMCPSQPSSSLNGYSTYAGVYHDDEAPIGGDNHGVFFLDSRIRREDVTDGTGQTLFLGEKIVEAGDWGWMSGTRATLRNTGVPLNTTGKVGGVVNWAIRGIDAPDEGMGMFGGGMMPPGAGLMEGAEGMPGMMPEMDVAKQSEAEETAEPTFPPGPLLPVGGFASAHAAGVQFAFGDGHVDLLGDSIALDVLKQLGHRCDGKLLSRESY